MLKLNRMSIICLSVAFVAGCGNPPPEDTLAEKLGDVMEEGPASPALDVIAPETAATLDRNDYVAVLLIDLPPGEQIPEHDAGLRAVYALTDSTLLKQAGDSGDVHAYSTGEVDVWSGGRYAIENTGDETARMVLVDRTAAALVPPSGDTLAGDPSADNEPSTALYSGEFFEIERIEPTPDSTRSVQRANPCSVFTLTPATLVVDGEDGEADVMDVFANRSVWFEGGTAWTVQAGEDAVALVVFEIKK